SRKSGGMEANWFRNASQSVSQIASDDASPSRKRRRTSKQIVAASGDVARCFQARAPAGPHRPAKAPCAPGPPLNTVAGGPRARRAGAAGARELAGPHRPAKAPCAHGPQLNTVAGSPAARREAASESRKLLAVV